MRDMEYLKEEEVCLEEEEVWEIEVVGPCLALSWWWTPLDFGGPDCQWLRLYPVNVHSLNMSCLHCVLVRFFSVLYTQSSEACIHSKPKRRNLFHTNPFSQLLIIEMLHCSYHFTTLWMVHFALSTTYFEQSVIIGPSCLIRSHQIIGRQERIALLANRPWTAGCGHQCSAISLLTTW